jgi:hypothetical protein
MRTLVIISLLIIPGLAHAFGAIAIDSSAGKQPPIYAIVVGKPSERAAADAATNACITKGGTNCTVVATFEHCGSFAASATSYGAGWGATGRHARNMSLRQCGDDCRVIENLCEDY